MRDLFADVRQTLRALVRQPSFASAAVITVALAIAANTAVFALIDGVLLRPLPIPGANAVVRIEERHSGRPVNLTGATFDDVEARSRALEAIAGYRLSSASLKAGDVPLRVASATVTRGYLDVLQVAPIAGRTFQEADFAPGARGVLLHEGVWTRAFGRDPQIVGRTITINAAPAEVVGVLPAAAYFPGDPGVVIPMDAGDSIFENRRSHLLTVIARLAPGTSLASANAELRAIASSITIDSHRADGDITLESSRLGERLTRSVRPAMLIVWAAVGMVLLIACANVAGLLLARATARSRDLAVRAALGCSRGRLFRHLALESTIVALLGGCLGVAAAFVIVPLLMNNLPASLPRTTDIRVDARVLGAGFCLSFVMAALFGTLPGLRAARTPAMDALRTRDRLARSGVLRSAVVATQIAITVVLVAGTGLLGRSMLRVASVAPGFDPGDVLVIDLSLPAARYPSPAAHQGFYREVLERVAAAPGVESAAVTGALPLGGTPATDFAADGLAPDQTVTADIIPASAAYFRTMRIPLLAGRAFGADDRAGGAAVAIVSQSAARAFWGDGPAVGRRITMRDWGAPYEATVVGVVGDVHQSGLEAAVSPSVYFPFEQFPRTMLSDAIVVRHQGNIAAVTASARAALAAVDPEQPITRVSPFTDILSRALAERRFNTLLVASFGAIALALASVGLYGLVAFVVASRRRELAVRMALGATPSRLLRVGALFAARPVASGLAAGVAGALFAGRALQVMLFDVSARDVPSIAAAVALVFLVTIVASAAPLARMLRADPLPALTGE